MREGDLFERVEGARICKGVQRVPLVSGEVMRWMGCVALAVAFPEMQVG